MITSPLLVRVIGLIWGNRFMWNRLPRPREFAVLCAIAVVCTVILAITKEYHAGLAILSGPVFVVSAIMGLNRHAELNKASADESPVEAAERDGSEA